MMAHSSRLCCVAATHEERERVATKRECWRLTCCLFLIFIVSTLGHYALAYLGYANNYDGTVQDEICSSSVFHDSLVVSISVSLIGAVYITANIMSDHGKSSISLESLVVSGSLLVFAVYFTLKSAYLLHVCDDAVNSALASTHGVGIGYQIFLHTTSQISMSLILLILRLVRPLYFTTATIIPMAILSSLKLFAEFTMDIGRNDVARQAISWSFNLYLIFILVFAVICMYRSYKTSPTFSPGRIILGAIAFVAVFRWVGMMLIAATLLDSVGLATIAAIDVYVRLMYIVVLLVLSKYIVFYERILISDKRDEQMALLNAILPPRVADQLLQKKRPEVESYNNVTVLFSDIKGFTDLAAKCPPHLVMSMLNDLYMVMDYCCNHFNLYKVETIGDAYMIASGISDNRDSADGAVAVANFAILVLYCSKLVLSPVDGSPIELRIGINSGPVAAGVVGRLMPRYCLFGDTVNIANRMEANSEPMRILVSEATATLLQNRDIFELESRGLVDIKGKGLMKAHWLTKALLPANTLLTPQLLEAVFMDIQTVQLKRPQLSMLSKNVRVLLVEESTVMRKVTGRAIRKLGRELGQNWIIIEVSRPEDAIALVDGGSSSAEVFDIIFTAQYFSSTSSQTGSELIHFLMDRHIIIPSKTITIGMARETMSIKEMLSSGARVVLSKPLPPSEILRERMHSMFDN